MRLHIYGDNIVECERIFALLQIAVQGQPIGIRGNVPAPIRTLQTANGDIDCCFFPGFGRWENDIISYIRKAGGILRETPDVFITKVDYDIATEVPIFAVEFCSALPAGNQAWQRSGRAYSTARSGIPYIFVTEIGGYELDSNRNKKSPRLPNPSIPFSFISYSQMMEREIIIAYMMNYGADDVNRKKYKNIVYGQELYDYVKAKIYDLDPTEFLNILSKKALNFVKISSGEGSAKSLSSSQWENVFAHLNATKSMSMILKESSFPWKKKISIPTRPSFNKALVGIEKIGNSVGASDLPFCVVDSSKKEALKSLLRKIYRKLPKEFLEVLDDRKMIAVCCINGFKPHGDDARPDRGLLPFLRMLLGDDIHVLSFVYGPAKSTMVEKLKKTPNLLAQENGLWESVIALSDLIICESKCASHAILQQGKARLLIKNPSQIVLPINNKLFPLENKIGEHDVDSVVHYLFSELLKEECFESMCNPPGGDWSGVSILDKNNNEIRWLTLPRVSQSGKRPDHIIQLFSGHIISIESKDHLRNLEKEIGNRLNQYCIDLFSSPPSCVKRKKSEWTGNIINAKIPIMEYISGCAFIITDKTDMKKVLNHTKTDFAIGVEFVNDKTAISFSFSAQCPLAIKNLLTSINIPSDINMSLYK